MDLIITLVVGLVAGYAAQRLLPGKDLGEGSPWMTTMIGVVGGIIGAILAGVLGLGALFGDLELIGRFILALLGSLLILWVYRLVSGRR